MRLPLIKRNRLIPGADRLRQPARDMRLLRNPRHGLEIRADGEQYRAGAGETAECLALGAEVDFVDG